MLLVRSRALSGLVGGEYREYDVCGHNPMEERETDFVRDVTQFVEEKVLKGRGRGWSGR